MIDKLKNALIVALVGGLAAIPAAFFVSFIWPFMRIALAGPDFSARRLTLDWIGIVLGVCLVALGFFLLWRSQTKLAAEAFPQRVSSKAFVYLLVICAFAMFGAAWLMEAMDDIRMTTQMLNLP